MKHSYIEENHIADRYLLGKLSAQERVRFEEHYENCLECLNRLETIDSLRRGLRVVAREEVWRSRAYIRAGLLARLVRLGRASQAVLLAGVILLITLPMGWLTLEWSRVRRELAQTRQTAAEWQRKYEEREQAARDLMKDAQARGQLAARPESEQEDRSRQPEEKVTPSKAVIPIFALSVMRNRDPELSQPVNRIRLSPTAKSIILLLELGPEPDLQSYRVAISTADGRNIWRENNLKPTYDSALALGLNSSLFKPGNYLLTLEGFTTQKRYVLTARYTLAVHTR
jgi:Putative zinc-finger